MKINTTRDIFRLICLIFITVVSVYSNLFPDSNFLYPFTTSFWVITITVLLGCLFLVLDLFISLTYFLNSEQEAIKNLNLINLIFCVIGLLIAYSINFDL